MSRDCRALIDLGALRHNLSAVRKFAPRSPVMAVVKANAYGHGLPVVARALADADSFAVACIEEALAVREAGLTQPVVLLEGVSSAEALDAALANHFEVVIHDPSQLPLLARLNAADSLTVWLKIDTGMNRLGFPVAAARDVWQQLSVQPGIRQPIGLMTHLANADDPADDFSRVQIERFKGFSQDLPGPRSIANSAGIAAWPASHDGWVRPGVMLYGVSPLLESVGADHDLQPAMTVTTRLIAVKQLAAGDRVGYGGSWVAPEPMPVGIAAIGYGDGYPRHAPSGTPVLVNGRRQQLVGRVSMDMIAVDLRGNDAAVGDPVTLWGQGLPVEYVARDAGTIPYELLCGVTQRVKFSLQDDDKADQEPSPSGRGQGKGVELHPSSEPSP
ncbi:MAG TPA: alanine racemase [Gammaproteobacteria bacterium]|nr:alanine racemase [Gammaproteobacteria bacterium]HET7588544.1 alanine racemase [Gammaproteobacteria bacterium]